MKVTKLDYRQTCISVFPKQETTTSWRNSIDQVTTSNDLIERHLKNKTKPDFKAGDKVFFMPDGLITRLQVEDLKNKFGIVKVRDADKADYVVANPTFFKKRLKSLNYDEEVVPVSDVKEVLLDIVHNGIPDINTIMYGLASSKIVINNDSILEFVDSVLDRIQTSHLSFTKNTLLNFGLIDTDNYTLKSYLFGLFTKNKLTLLYYFDENDYPAVKAIVDASDKWYTEDSVLDCLDKGIPMTAEMYENLFKMLRSSNPSDRELALSTMGGFDLDKSMGYISFLYFQLEDAFKYSAGFRHANFRLVKNNIEKIERCRHHGSLITQLQKEGWLTEDVLKLILEHKIRKLLSSYDVTEGYFSIDSITINKPELKELYGYKFSI
jgi:hypothetical protein